MNLIIAEKPSLGRAIQSWLKKKSKTDGRYLQYSVTWLFGHMLELDKPEDYDPKYKSWNLDLLPIIPSKFNLHLKNDTGIKKQVNSIKIMLKDAVEIINAGDPDREGQLLVDEVLDFLGNKKPVKRLWLSAIDDKSIERAFSSIKNNSEFIGYKLAAETRSRADWLVGMNYSRVMSHVFKANGYPVISIGRVQTPTLKLIVDRDNEIKNFVSRDFFELVGLFANNIASLSARLILPESIKMLLKDNLLLDKQPLIELSNAVTNKSGKVESYTKQNKSSKQPLLFNLSELQAFANKKLGYSAKEVLNIAQDLYENKLISYPRSDCQYMPMSQYEEASNILNLLIKVPEYSQLSPMPNIKSVVWNDAKVTAHHAIVPTGANLDTFASLGIKQRDLFNLIAMQYIMQFYPESRYDEVEIIINVDKYQFKAMGRTITDLGWKMLITLTKDDDNLDEDEAQVLPILTKGQEIKCISADIITKKTQKPKPYTEGTLIKAMQNIHNKIPELVKAENYDQATTERLIKDYRASLKDTAGLGTEATRAGIIETLKDRGFITGSKKNIISTKLGALLIDSLVNDPVIRKELGFLVSPLTTAQYEQYLDAIQNNVGHPEKFLDNIKARLNKLTEFSSLKFNIPINEEALEKINKQVPVKLGRKCPECESEIVEREGRYGKFISCSAYPTCKWTPPKPEKPKINESGEVCPECNSGTLTLREGKYGKFKACNAYPKCKYIKKGN
jgi:DNA topoisomerase-3